MTTSGSRFRTLCVAAALAATVLVATAALAGDTFVVDPGHSSVTFKIRHLVANVTGRFGKFSGTIDLDRTDPAKSTVEVAIEAASIDTGVANRDEHLRSEDFFDVAKFPQIAFKSKRIAKKSGDSYEVTGDFTMHGVTKEITVPVQLLGVGKGPRGGDVAGFSSTFTIDRKDYGIVWNRGLDAGGVVLGDTVTCELNFETGHKPPQPAPAPASK